MGCGASVDASARHAPVLPPRDENLLASIPPNKALDDLPDCVSDLHHGMPAIVAQAPMRLIKIVNLLSWPNMKVYEDIAASACVNMPYMDVGEDLWDQTAVLSWRWGANKPAKLERGFSPMLEAQFRELCEALTRLKDHGIVYVWIDWCCVPQYSANSMVEVMRSKVFYARARAMVIIPTFHPIPADGVVRLLLVRAARCLKKRAHKSSQCALAASVVNGILAREMVAGREYFSRVWTLAERMARHGRSEQLCNWLSLEAWLGMVVDAMLKSTEDKTASQIYKKILGRETGELLDSILAPLAVAVETGSMLVSEGLEDLVAQLFDMAAGMWQSASILQEAPTKSWLLSYMEEAHTGIYQAWNEGDKVWAVYSYFCWKQLDQLSQAGLLEALQDLARVAGAHRVQMMALAGRLGILKIMPVDENDVKLFRAAEEGSLEEVQELLKAGANVLMVKEEEENLTALYAACMKGHLEVARALVAAGANVNAPTTDGSTPLHMAARNGFVDLTKYLLEVGANKEAANKDGATPLFMAAQKDETATLQVLLDAGANKDVALKPDGHTPLITSVLNHHIEVMKMLLAAKADVDASLKDGATALYLAAEKGRLDVLKELVKARAKIDRCMQSGATPLYIAAQHNFPEVAKALIAEKANVNAARKDQSTPLYIASEWGHLATVEVLLEAGADVEAMFQSGASSIYVAAQKNRAEVVKALIAKGANKLIRLKGGYTPIHSAALAGHVEVVQILIEAGVDKNIPLDDGATPIYLAAERGHAPLVKYLLEAGADTNIADVNGKRPADVAKQGTGVKEMLA